METATLWLLRLVFYGCNLKVANTILTPTVGNANNVESVILTLQNKKTNLSQTDVVLPKIAYLLNVYLLGT